MRNISYREVNVLDALRRYPRCLFSKTIQYELLNRYASDDNEDVTLLVIAVAVLSQFLRFHLKFAIIKYLKSEKRVNAHHEIYVRNINCGRKAEGILSKFLNTKGVRL